MGDPGLEESPTETSLALPHVIHAFNDNDSALVAINSTSELSILNTEIPAGQMQNGDVYSLRITAESLNSTGGPVTFRLRFYFGVGLVDLDTGARSIASDANVRTWWIQVDMASVIGSANAVKISGLALCSAGSTDSWPALTAAESSIGSASATSSNEAMPIGWTVQMGTASVNAYFDISPGWHLLRFPHQR
jgi:hypothetical protein